uniref:Ig-like domain-containing protein n=1 Tax=Sparus aurata TaxID=8175 RepID=A0A671WQT6_SPAAU
SEPMVKRPGESHRLTCTASGFTFSSYEMNWIRQPAGKGLEWIGIGGVGWSTGDTHYKDSLKNKFSIDLDSSSKTVTLNGQNVQSEDTAVYYCARRATVRDNNRRVIQKLLPLFTTTGNIHLSQYHIL